MNRITLNIILLISLFGLVGVALAATKPFNIATILLLLNEDAPKPDGSLNDTGITFGGDFPEGNNETCTGGSIAQQDCSSGRDVTHNDDSDGLAGFSYTRIDEDRCVQDNVTGLMWEVKTTDGGLHDADDRYFWYNTDANTNGGTTGDENTNGATCHDYNAADASTFCNTEAYVARVNATNFCGYSDWRLPNVNELISLVHLGKPQPNVDTQYFPNTRTSGYWTSILFLSIIDKSYTVELYYGGFVPRDQNSSQSIRLVRTWHETNP
ncbi:MAG: DUF1566 domain-containing protein [Arenicellales bacterium]